MSNEMITVSRAGSEIGKYLEADLLMLIEQKQVLPTDHYWKPGMTAWALISDLLAARKAAERQAKAAADAEAARLKKEQEEVARAEAAKRDAIRAAEKEEARNKKFANAFTCHCCRHQFLKPVNPADSFIIGVLICIGAGLLLLIPVFGWVAGPFVAIFGLIKMLVSGLTSPHCPSCRSTNFSRPESETRPVFNS